MEKIKELEEYKIGLVLAGGGAKGAYEAGVFKALGELGLVDQIKVVSGTSVGAVNALLLSMDNGEIIDNSWMNLSYSRFIHSQEKSRNINIQSLIEKIKHRHFDNSLLEQLKLNDIGLFSQGGVRNFIEEYVDAGIIKNSNRTIYACAYNIEDELPEYFKLSDYSEDEIINIVLASCAIPFMFKPININGKRYADGGINSPEYSKSNVDNVPIYPLINHNCDFIIVVHLSYKHMIDKTLFGNHNIIELYPSTPLELISGTGSLRINANTLKDHIDLGYRDAMVLLSPIVINILRKKDFSLYIERIEEENRVLIQSKM